MALRFQFPTGWNSTKAEMPILYVNISFNSQRDGILQSPSFRNQTHHAKVSIPNGMEFYTIEATIKTAGVEFQFPTGWNSTQLPKELWSWNAQEFQFPTGWNSTLIACDIRRRERRFQFPTGWNSTFLFRWGRALLRVSIPNGMEFYSKYDV